MERVSFDTGAENPDDTDIDRAKLSEPLGASDVAINHYRLGPGDGFPGGLHAHMEQEEVFLVLDGEATFETMDGEISVDSGEAIRFAPGEFKSGKNDADADLVALAIGAPRDSEDVRIPVDCPDCGHDDVRIAAGDEDVRFACPDCESEQVSEPCPDCGDDDLRVTLGDGGATVTVCQDCGAEYESPPLRDA